MVLFDEAADTVSQFRLFRASRSEVCSSPSDSPCMETCLPPFDLLQLPAKLKEIKWWNGPSVVQDDNADCTKELRAACERRGIDLYL